MLLHLNSHAFFCLLNSFLLHFILLFSVLSQKKRLIQFWLSSAYKCSSLKLGRNYRNVSVTCTGRNGCMKACWCVHGGLQWFSHFTSKGSGVKAQQPSAIAQYIDMCFPGGPAAHPLKSPPNYYLMRIGNSWRGRHFERAARRHLWSLSFSQCSSLRQLDFVVKSEKHLHV